MFLRYLARSISIVLIWLPSLGTAQADFHKEWATIAYDQAVLAHRMTKSACLVMLGFEAPYYQNQIKVNSDRFLAQFSKLSAFPRDPSIPNDRWDEIQTTVKKMEQYFDPMVRSALQISAGDRHSMAVNLLLDRDAMATWEFTTLAYVTARDIEETPIENAIFSVMEQRIISQQMLRDLCFVRAGFAGQNARERLRENITEFSRAIDVLIHGDSHLGIPTAPNIHIKLKLRAVQPRWKRLSDLVHSTLESEALTTQNMQLASIFGDAVLLALDQVLIEFSKLP